MLFHMKSSHNWNDSYRIAFAPQVRVVGGRGGGFNSLGIHRYVVFVCAHFIRKYSPTLCIFYIHFISYEIRAFDFIWNMYTFGWLVHTVSQALLFFWTFHLKFYFNLKLSYLNLSVWTDTTIFCFGLTVCWCFGGSLSEGLCSLFWRRFSVIFGTRQFSCFFICGLCLIFVFVWSGLASILD